MTDLHVVTDGPTGGDPIVLVHAGIADHRMWDGVVEDLASDHRVIRYDVRGFGASPDPSEDYRDHRDLVAVLDHVGVGRATLVGCSNGGRICADTALESPDRVARLVLVGAGMPGGSEVNPELADLWERGEEAFHAGDADAVATSDVEAWVVGLGRNRDDVDPSVLERAHAWARDVAAREIARGEDAPGPQEIDPPIRERLGDIGVATLVLLGRHDQTVVNDNGRRYAAEVPDADLLVVGDAAHLVSVEQPGVFVGALRAWLAAHPLAG